MMMWLGGLRGRGGEGDLVPLLFLLLLLKTF